MEQHISFAHFANRDGVKPQDLGILVTLAHRAFSAGEKACNSGDTATVTRRDKACRQFENKAAELGYQVEWPGLRPVLRKNGSDVSLPEC